MKESLKELNKIVQKPRYKEVGNWMVRHILRDAALPVTALLIRTPVTANQVTLVSLVIGFIGVLFLSIPASSGFLIGVLLLQLWYYLDHVDGQLARYHKTASLSGRYFDFMTHHIIHIPIFFCLGLYCYFRTGNFLLVFWGFIATLAMTMFNVSQDVKFKTFYERLISLSQVRVLKKTESETPESATPTKDDSVRKVFSFLHKSCEIHVLMNILTLAAFLEVFLAFRLRGILFFYYSITALFIACVKISYLILNKEIDTEFNATFWAVDVEAASAEETTL